MSRPPSWSPSWSCCFPRVSGDESAVMTMTRDADLFSLREWE